jgi:hypothetical protein
LAARLWEFEEALAVLTLIARDKRRGSTVRSAGPAALGLLPPPRLEEGVMRSLAPNLFAEPSGNARYLRTAEVPRSMAQGLAARHPTAIACSLVRSNTTMFP